MRPCSVKIKNKNPFYCACGYVGEKPVSVVKLWVTRLFALSMACPHGPKDTGWSVRTRPYIHKLLFPAQSKLQQVSYNLTTDATVADYKILHTRQSLA